MDIQSIGKVIQKFGWTCERAGADDFNLACAAIQTAIRERRGLIISGKYGCGKTLLAKCHCRGIGGAWFNVSLGVSGELEKLSREWQSYWANDPYHKNVFLDDLGSEQEKNEYGVRSESVADFITTWHARADPTCQLVITTNLGEQELDARYGGRVLSRLKDLCIPLRLTGADKREWILPTGSTERNDENRMRT